MSDVTPKNKNAAREILETVWNSCEEGITGAWDCSADGFRSMQDLLVEAAKLLKIPIAGEYTGDLIEKEEDA